MSAANVLACVRAEPDGCGAYAIYMRGPVDERGCGFGRRLSGHVIDPDVHGNPFASPQKRAARRRRYRATVAKLAARAALVRSAIASYAGPSAVHWDQLRAAIGVDDHGVVIADGHTDQLVTVEAGGDDHALTEILRLINAWEDAA